MEKDNTAAYLGLGLLTGMLIGVAVGLLYAPKAGPETRAMLKEKATEFKEKASEVADKVRTRAGEMMHRGQEEESGGCA